MTVAGGDANCNSSYGPLPTSACFGGDIFNAGTLTLTNDWITNGFACSGAGVANYDGTATIEGTLVSGNNSACSGGGDDSGGIENYGTPGSPDLPGHLVIDDSTIAANDARLVGGVYSWNDGNNTLTITNSTIADNAATAEGGGPSRGQGGGLGLGDGIARIENTILAGNFRDTPSDQTNCQLPGPALTSLGDNIDSGTDCHLHDTIPGQTDQSDSNPLIGPLQNNGGPTMTIAIAPGSPALNRVPRTGSGCPATDQRGVPRPQGTGCDIGAFELQVPPTCVGVTSNDTGAGTVTIGLSCGGTAPGPLTYALRSNPAHGTLAGFNPSTGVVQYTPSKGFVGTDTFSYSGASSGGTANTATVTIVVIGILDPTMTWGFAPHKSYTTIASLVAKGVMNGAKLKISCSGGGCRWKSHTSVPPTPKSKCKKGHPCPKPKQSTTDTLSGLFKGWHLRNKAKITVNIAKTGYIGKVFIFSFRPPRGPSSTISCLAPGSSTPGKGC